MSRGPFGRLLQPLEHRPDGVALMEVLPVVLLPVGYDRLGLAELVEHDDQLAPLDLLDLAGEQLADLGGELLPDAGPLAFPYPLNDPLLGRLHREPAELDEGNLLLEHVADLEVGVLVLGLFQRDLPAGILDGLDDLPQADDLDGALQLVHAQLEPDVGAELAHQGGMNAVPQELQQIGALELFCRGQLAERGQHLSRTSHPFTPYRRLPSISQSTTNAASRIASSASVTSDPSSSRSTTCSSSGTARISTRRLARAATARVPARAVPRIAASARATAAAARARATRLPARSAARPSPCVPGNVRGTG